MKIPEPFIVIPACFWREYIKNLDTRLRGYDKRTFRLTG